MPVRIPAPVAPDFRSKPPPLTLRRLDDPALVLTAQFLPGEAEEKFGADYARQKVVGLSHTVMQFIGTTNTAWKFGLDYHAVGHNDSGEAAADRLIAARLFLKTSCRPRPVPGDVASAAAPRIYLFWPNFFTMTCVITDVSIKYTQFNGQSRPVRMRAEVSVEEIRDTIILSDQFFDEAP